MSEPENKTSTGTIAKRITFCLFTGLFFAVAVPKFLHSRQLALRNACLNHLIQIDGAKQQWRSEHKKIGTDIPTWEDIKPYIVGNAELKCPVGGSYIIGKVDEEPMCSLGSTVTPAHSLQ